MGPSVKSPGIDIELRELAEEMARKRREYSRQDQSPLSPEQTNRLLSELQIHQIELEIQNEELRRAQGNLELLQNRYFDLFDLAPIGYCSLTDHSMIVEANLTAASMLGHARGTLVRRPLSQFILAEDQDIYYLHHHKLVGTGSPQVCELRMVRLDGTFFWARLESIARIDEKGTPTYWMVICDISPTKQAQALERKTLQEKETLLRELYHRTKNNMQMICSMLTLQAAHFKSDEVKAMVRETNQKIKAMALVHQMLYQSRNLSSINLAEYIPGLADLAIQTTQGRANSVQIDYQLMPLPIPLDIAIPLGLVLNELLTNTLKYAFPDPRSGRITIALRALADDWFELEYADDGIGVPADFDPRSAQSFGLPIIIRIVESQLEGSIAIDTGCGLRYRIRFPLAILNRCGIPQ